jgi:hypothetical protein
MVVVGSTAGGALGGAGVGAVTIPLVGSVPGAVIGGIAGGLIGVGSAILADPPSTVYFTDYGSMTLTTPSAGNINLETDIINSILANESSTITLPGGGKLILPNLALGFSNDDVESGTLLGNDTVLPSGEVEVGVIQDTQGNDTVGLFYEDPVDGFNTSDYVDLYLNDVVNPADLTNGYAIDTASIFAEANVPEPTTGALVLVGVLGAAGRRLRRKNALTV